MTAGGDFADYRHFRIDRDDDGVCWVRFDVAGKGTNVLDENVIREFSTVLDAVSEADPSGLVIASAKPDGFIAGADVNEFVRLESPAAAAARMTEVHAIFARLERFPCATVAMIKGACLGGGLELALACRYRVACDEPSTRIGFPEVMLGIHPGFGGSVRAIERAGVASAMPLMLTGRTLRPRPAARIGLVDKVVPARHLERASRTLALDGREPRRAPLRERLLNAAPARPPVAWLMSRQLKRRVRREHYPAPYALVDLWRRHGGDRTRMLEAEIESVSRLLVTDTSRQLVRLFFLRERLRQQGGDYRDPERAQRLHVIGAGTMGGDIAAWAALRGFRVTLQDRAARYIAPAIKRAHDLFERRLRKPEDVTAALDRLCPDPGGLGMARADIVVEAVVEDLEVKRALFTEIEAKAGPGTLLATNTSSIPLEDIASALDDPGRLVGLHFFNPVAKMQLVEVVAADGTADDVRERAAAFAVDLDRMPLPVQSAPGFLVNRILVPYLLEAVLLLEEQVDARRIDEAATAFGMPMGPLELADRVGLDICLSVGRMLAGTVGAEVPSALQKRVDAGHLGVKTGRGFYAYRGRRRTPVDRGTRDVPADEIQDRLMLQIVNESLACLADGIVADADLLDAGMVFGTGFAPFRGGPLAWLEAEGRATLSARMRALNAAHGERFTPHAGWD